MGATMGAGLAAIGAGIGIGLIGKGVVRYRGLFLGLVPAIK